MVNGRPRTPPPKAPCRRDSLADASPRCARRCEAPASAMCSFFALVEKRYGSVDAYLDSIGVDAALRQRCVTALTVST